jgi:poly(beta-D-mannuronate) lyase
MIFARPLTAVALLVVASCGFASTYQVDSVAALQAQLTSAKPGDMITVRNGTYTTKAPIAVRCAGAEGRPITIAAETIGGVEIGGAGGFEVTKPAAFVVVQGFKFTHAVGRATIGAGTSHVRFTRNTFVCSGEGVYLTVTGDDAEVDHNEFRDKHTLGNMLSVTGTGSQVARRLHVHHNFFHDFTKPGGNGAETLRFGLSGLSMSRGEGLVEYNLFLRCTGENELISNKSCANTYRYNTFLDSPGAELSQRHGNDCLYYGNYLKHTQGIRIFGDRHLVFSNYLEENSSAIHIGNGDGEVADGAKLTCHDRPDGCVIAFNTLVNNQVNYQMADRKDGLGATNTTFANNLIQGSGAVAKIGGPNPGAIWRGNLLWKTGPAGDLPAGGFSTTDPLLARGADGLMRPSATSPAIGAATGDFPGANVDMDGQPRPAKKSIGADEPGDAPIVARLLTPADVGPAAR